MSDQIQFAPFREYADVIGSAQNYAIPDFKDLSRLNNRITNNLLYYQTNYFLFFLAIFVVIGIIHPQELGYGLLGFGVITGGFLFITNKSPEIQRLKRDKPFLSLFVNLLIAGFIFKLMGSLMMFLFSICLPISVISLHASFRLRSLKNKVSNRVESIGLARTPMGFLLEQLGATNEAAS